MRAREINIIDVEASGLSATAYPIEVGVVLSDGRHYQSLIAPAPGWTHWDESAEKLHGLSRHDLLRHGKPIQQVCEELNEFCGGKTLYSDWWVKDCPWINALFGEAGTACDFRLSPIELLVDEETLTHWTTFKRSCGQDMQLRPHRALNDAVVIAETLRRLEHCTSVPRDHEDLHDSVLLAQARQQGGTVVETIY